MTLDGFPDDGAPGESDNVGTDVEGVHGAEGADKITGGAAADARLTLAQVARRGNG